MFSFDDCVGVGAHKKKNIENFMQFYYDTENHSSGKKYIKKRLSNDDFTSFAGCCFIF